MKTFSQLQYSVSVLCLAASVFLPAVSGAMTILETTAAKEAVLLPALLISVRSTSYENPVFALVQQRRASLVAVSDTEGKAYELVINNAVDPYGTMRVTAYGAPVETASAWMPVGAGVGIDLVRLRDLVRNVAPHERHLKFRLLFSPAYRAIIEASMRSYMQERGLDPQALRQAGKRLRLHATMAPDGTISVDGHASSRIRTSK